MKNVKLTDQKEILNGVNNENHTGGADNDSCVIQVCQLYGTIAEPNPSGGRVYDCNGIMRTLGAGHGMSQPLIVVKIFNHKYNAR